MMQKFQDFVELVKQQKKYQVGLGLAAAALVYLYIAPAAPGQSSNRRRAQTAAQQNPLNIADKETYTDLIDSIKVASAKTDTQVKNLAESMKKVADRQDEFEKSTTEIFRKIIERVNENPTGGANSNSPVSIAETGGDVGVYNPDDVSGGAYPGGDPNAAQGAGLQQANVNTNPGQLEEIAPATTANIPAPPPRGARKIAAVMTGSFVRVKLIAGVNAPTDGTPYPVLFKVVGAINGPNDSALPVGDALVTAAAQGSLTDQRVLFRMTKLSMAYPNGRQKEFDIDGWIVGEDGMRGMEGVLLDPIGKAIGAGIMTGALQGAGEALASKNVTTSSSVFGGNSIVVSGSESEYIAGRALARGADRWQGVIDGYVKQLVPHVQVLSGREGTAVFAKSFAIPELYDDLQVEEDVFHGID